MTGAERKMSRNGKAVLMAAALAVGAIAASPVAMAQDDVLAAARTMTPAQYAGPTTPAKAPKGIKIAVITCASVLHGCVSPADGITHAGEKLGWSVKVYDGGGTPSKQNAAILDAIEHGRRLPVTLTDARSTLELIAAIYASAFSGTRVHAGELDDRSPFYRSMAGTGAPWNEVAATDESAAGAEEAVA